jgi:hypothetical protein
MRAERAQAGISLVQRQARLPVPPRPDQRHHSRPRPGQEHLRPRDQILPHLAAIAILLREPGRGPSGTPGIAQITGPVQAADLIDTLRTSGVILTYDPDQQTLRCQDHLVVTIGNSR